MARIDEIKEFIQKDPSRMAGIIYKISRDVMIRKRPSTEVIWTFKDGSYGSVQFRMSDANNWDKAASIPAYTFNYDGSNPNYTVCMSCTGKMFAIVDTYLVTRKYEKLINEKATKGFVGYNLYKDFTEGVELIYA